MDRRCINCGEKIIPEPYDAVAVKVDYPANAASWIAGFCSRWCMVAKAMASVKSGTAWWLQPDPKEIDNA